MFELADVQLELGGGTIDLEVAVAPSGTLTHPALIGRDVPGMQLTMKLDQEPQDVLPVMTRAAAKREHERQAADDKASRAEPIAVEDLPEREDDSQQDDAEGE